jgi:ParB-like chromosome segregation protein Spo0J
LVGADGDVIAGHGRLAAARQLGMADVPVVVLSNLSELQRRQLVLADNRIALNAGWDLDMLKLEMSDLKAMGADLSLLGFDEKELSAAFALTAPGLTDEDAVPDVQEVAVSAPGDVWSLGTVGDGRQLASISGPKFASPCALI